MTSDRTPGLPELARAAARDYIEAMTGDTDFAVTIEEQTWPA